MVFLMHRAYLLGEERVDPMESCNFRCLVVGCRGMFLTGWNGLLFLTIYSLSEAIYRT